MTDPTEYDSVSARTDRLIRQLRENVGRLKVQFEDLEDLTNELETIVAPTAPKKRTIP